jgi:uncharacterized protein (TIGR04141 family)
LIKDNIFSIVGGHGYHVISPYLDQSFSLRIIERIFDKTSSVFKALQDRSLVGNIIGASKIFRSHANLAVEEDFGKMFEKAITYIDKDRLRSLGLSNRKGCSCFSGSGLRLSLSVSLKDARELCKSLAKLLDQEPLMILNDISEVNDEKKSEQLDLVLAQKIWDYSTGKDVEVDLDFTHRNIFKFLYAERIEITEADHTIATDIIPTMPVSEILIATKSCFINCLDHNQILEKLNTIRVNSYNDSESKPLTKGSLKDHLHGELDLDGKKYFLINGRWLKLASDMEDSLNNTIKGSFSDTSSDWVNIPYNLQNLRNSFNKRKPDQNGIQYEEEYNRLYLDLDNVVVLDRVYYDGKQKVEICDLMRCHNDIVELVQVKTGFCASIRDAAEQIVTSASILFSWRKTNSEAMFDKYYDSALDKYRKDYPNHSLKMNKSLMTSSLQKRDLVFTLAFIDNIKKPPSCLTEYRSMLAKIAIVNAKKRLSEIGFDLRIVRIPVEDG